MASAAGVSCSVKGVELISDMGLKNSSLRRWKRTSTLDTAKGTPFSVNLQGFGRE